MLLKMEENAYLLKVVQLLRTFTPVISYKEILHSRRYISAMTFDFNKHTHW